VGWTPGTTLAELVAHMQAVLPLVLLGSLLLGCADRIDGQDAPDSELYVKFMQARDSVAVGDPWGEATGRIEQRLGPAKVKTDTEWRWAALQGDECFDLRVMRTGVLDHLESITNTYATAAVAEDFARCKAVAQSISVEDLLLELHALMADDQIR
jgi:hypothetical protein